MTRSVADLADLASIARTGATARPGSIALQLGPRRVSYAALDDRSSQVAQALRAAGVQSGDRVVFLDHTSIEWFEVAFGAAKIGAVIVPVSWRLAPPEIAAIIDHSEARVVIVGEESHEVIQAVVGELERVELVVAIGGHRAWPSYGPWVDAQPPDDPGRTAAVDEVAVQLYTSGTTGMPKGVMLTHGNLCGMLRNAGGWRLSSASVSLALLPLFHIAGAGWALVGLAHGCRTVLVRDLQPRDIRGLIREHAVTHALMVPAIIQMLLRADGDDQDFRTLGTLVYGASPIADATLIEALRVFDAAFVQVYGLTETSGAVTELGPEAHDPHRRARLLRSCGRPLGSVELRIVDPSSGEDCHAGRVGEIWIRSDQNMKGYWRDPAATAAAVTSDGWLRTGDAGYLEEGYLFLHDRIKDMIVSGAENVYPTEVENALMEHPAVADAAVIGVPDDRWGEAVKAVVVRTPGHRVDQAELLAFGRTRLAGFKLPKSVDFVDELPRNPSGKILKRVLREPYWADAERQIG